MKQIVVLLLAVALLAGCAGRQPVGSQSAPAAAQAVATQTAPAEPSTRPSSAPTATSVPPASTAAPPTETPEPPTATPEPPTVTPEPPTVTPDPFAQYRPLTIPGLRERWAGGEFGTQGEIEIVQTLEETANFTRYLIAYRGDGLRLTGMLNRPRGDGPFPVVVLVHGYYPLDEYQTGNGTRTAADYLANRGFMTVSPDLRSHAGSDDAPNLFRAGHVVDVLHVIPQAQRLPDAQPGKVALWGHSNGGAIAAKAITVSDQIGAALIYAPASSTIAEDYQFRAERRAARAGQPPGRRSGVLDLLEIEFPVGPDDGAELYHDLSPLPFVEFADMPVQIHWGTADETVPRKWPEDVFNALTASGKTVEWFEYQGQPHSFQGAGNQLYLERMAEFFASELR